MMFDSLDTTLACSAISAVVGFVTALLVQRLVRRNNIQTEDGVSSTETPAKNEKDVDLLISSLYELTSHVDSQVGQHSVRISEITNTLETPGDIGSTMILVAGKMLVSSNQKLHADLEDARNEIQRQRDQMTCCMLESRIDALTSISNRRALDHELIRVFADRRRNGTTFCLLILDIDHFKCINDQYGHMVGDQMLKSFSRCLTTTFRESDFVARYGGEEFVAILPNTTIEEACRAAERIRSIIATTVHHVGDLQLQVTASIGLKEVQDNETDSEFLQRADRALYAAKNGGRNRCYYHDGVMCHPYVPVVAAVAQESEADSLDDTIAEIDTIQAEVESRPAKRLTFQRSEKVIA